MKALLLLLALLSWLPALGAELRGGGLVLPAQQVASSAGTKVLTLNDQQVIEVTGVAAHTVQLPDAVDVGSGWFVYVVNSSESVAGVEVRDDSGTLLAKLDFGQTGFYQLLDATLPKGKWAVHKLTSTGGGGGSMDLTALSADAPLEYNNVTGKFKMNPASGSSNGYLSSADFATFAAKLTSPLSGKGDLLTHDGAVHARLGAGTDGQLLTSDSASPTGLKWSAAPSGLPTQTGQSGKYLTTDGSTPSWSTVAGGLQYTDFSGTAPLAFNNTTGNFSMPAATAAQNGYLTSADWSIFNGKQAAGNYLTALTGEVVAAGPGSAAATVSNAAVIGKTLTGFTAGAGTVSATDSLLTAIQKHDGNIAANTTSLAGKQAGPLTGDVTTVSATNPATTIAANAVTSAKILDANVTSAKLADGAVDLSTVKVTGVAPISKGGTNLSAVPAPGQALVSTGTAYAGSDLAGPDTLRNVSFAPTFVANAMTLNILTQAGTAPTATDVAKIAFRTAGATNAPVLRQVTGTVGMVVPSGATLGLLPGVNNYVYVYAIDNAGAVELAVSPKRFDEGEVQNTTAIGTSSNDAATLYSTTARTSVAIRQLGRIKANNAVAGTWVGTGFDWAATSVKESQAAQINMGAQWVGSIKVTGCAALWSTTSTTYADFAVATGCTYSVTNGSTGIAAPSTMLPGMTFTPDDPTARYTFVAQGLMGQTNANNSETSFRFYDGTNQSVEEEFGSTQNNFNLRPTSQGSLVFTDRTAKQVRLRGMTTASGTAGVYATGPYSLTISVYKYPQASKLSATLITKDPLTNISSQLINRLSGTAPKAIGEYRTYTRGASTGALTDAAPATQPSAANGLVLYLGGAYGSADASNAPSAADVYIGLNKKYDVSAFAGLGFTTPVDITPYYNANNDRDYGFRVAYNPNSGILSIYRPAVQSAAAGHVVVSTTPGTAGANIVTAGTPIYFAITTYDNPLAAGLTAQKNEVRFYGQAGLGSVATRTPYFSRAVNNAADAFSYTNDSTNGLQITALKDVAATVCGSFETGAGQYIGSSVGLSAGNVDAATWTDEQVIARTVSPSGSASGYLSGNCGKRYITKGQVIRPHIQVSTTPSSIANAAYFSVMADAAPFETVGAASGGNVSSSAASKVEFVSYGGATETAACTSSPCTIFSSSPAVTSVTRHGTGITRINWAAGTWSVKPTCTYTVDPSPTFTTGTYYRAVSSTAYSELRTYNGAGTDTDGEGSVVCVGK